MKRRPPAKTGQTVVWAYYSVITLTAPVPAEGIDGLVVRGESTRSFWAAWWNSDPRRAPSDPDDFGIVEGPRSYGDAIGEAYAALRRARGSAVHDLSIGPSYAVAAFREGSPRKRAEGTDFDALAVHGYAALGLPDSASPQELTAAFKKRHPDHGGDPVVDMAELTMLYRTALAHAKRRQEQAQREAMRQGAMPPKRRTRTRSKADESRMSETR